MSVAFHRTSSGLSNLAIFLRVDVVVFTEGGDRDYAIAELVTDRSASETYDAMFWEAAFRVACPKVRAHFKSIGSKESVLSVSRLVKAGTVTNVITALDRDLDNVRARKLKHHNVLYTFGYSWENDVFTKESLKTLGKRFCLSRKRWKEIDQHIDNAFQDFERCLSILVRRDIALARLRKDICDRAALLDAIELRPPAGPKVSRVKMAGLLRSNLTQHRGVRICHPRAANVLRDIHGHTLERFSLGLLQHIFADPLEIRLSKDVSVRLLIGLFERGLNRSTPSARHYRKMLSAVVAK